MQANTNVIKGLHLIGKQENEENRRTAYQYDSYYRLRRVDYDCDYSSSDPTCANGRNNVFKCNQSETDCEDFQLDGVHNIRASRENQTDFTWTVDGFNRLTQKSWNNNSITYTYDSNNNMTGEDLDGDQNADITYTYDKLNRLTSVTNTDYLVEYRYDPFNRRTEKTVYYTENSNTFERTHKYAYDGWDIISEEIKTVRTSDTPNTVTSWQLRRYVDQGTDNHIIMDTVSCSNDGNGNCSPNESTLQRIWFHKDERGNVIAVSNGNGTIYERYRYRVYGDFEILDSQFSPKNCNNQTCYATNLHNFLWGGSLYEPETGLYWMRNRYYHIDMHRFINQDPIGIWGDANNLGNGFAYVAGMVIEASDPSGLDTDFNYFIDKNEIVVKPHPVDLMVQDLVVNAVLFGAAPGGLMGVSIKELAKKIGVSVWALVAIGVVGYDFYKLPEKLEQMQNAAKEHLDQITFKVTGITQKERLDSEFIPSISDDGKNFTMTYSFTDKDGKKYSLVLIYGHDGTKKELKVYEGKDLKKKYIWKSIGKSKNGNDIYGWVEVPIDSMPSDPYSDNDAKQNFVRNQLFKKILKMHEKKSFFETMEEEGPVIKYDDNGRKVFIFNPFYRGKDPLKEIIWEKQNADGTKGFVRNPFAPGAEYGYDSTTYEKWQQAGFIQPEVDPWIQ